MTPNTRRLLPRAVAVGFAVLLAGCGKSADPVVPVTGRVLVDGKPPVGATVTFHPVAAQPGDATRPVGQVDANGEFRLTTRTAGDGAPPGEYKVTVAWYAPAPGKKTAEGDDAPARSQLPEKFTKADATPLTAVVSPDAAGPITLTIKRN